MAVVGMLAVALPSVASVLPAKFVVTKSQCVEVADDGTCARYDDKPVAYALIPSAAQPVEPRLTVTGTTTYPSSGQILFVTVSQPPITLLDWFVARDNPAARLWTYTDKYGTSTPEQQLRSGQRQMTGAKDRATYVALKAAGFDVQRTLGPAVVDYVVCMKQNDKGTKCLEEAPAASLLQPDDVITKVNGLDIATIEDIPKALADVKAGDEVDVELRRGSDTVTGRVKTVLAEGEATPRTILGFVPIDTTSVVLPEGLSVEFDTGSIGGPSAGLAFTLTLIDTVTPGQLMGNQRVAVTGEIDIDGNVGPIGGLNSKASAVKQMGAKYFLVPASQPETGNDSIAAARRVVGDDVEIIPVATLDEALAALVRLGGDPLPASGVSA